jgi:hypothetical protein
MFIEFVSLGDPSRRMLMMVRECTSTGFPVLRMFGVEGKDGVILTLGDGWCNPNLGTRGGFCRM